MPPPLQLTGRNLKIAIYSLVRIKTSSILRDLMNSNLSALLQTHMATRLQVEVGDFPILQVLSTIGQLAVEGSPTPTMQHDIPDVMPCGSDMIMSRTLLCNSGFQGKVYGLRSVLPQNLWPQYHSITMWHLQHLVGDILCGNIILPSTLREVLERLPSENK